ncbi:MAG: hypothetical protein QM478_10065 [Flavobacteriaceae bacterium]
MNEKQNLLIEKSIINIKTCKDTLEKISSTCCMPIRSKKMQDTFNSLDRLDSQLKSADKELISNSIVEIEMCGSQIGKLYVSCCTDKREPLYQIFLKTLNETHTNIHKMMGTSH